MKNWVVGLVLLLSSSRVFGQQYDVLIRNGRVVDGMGNPWVYADVGVTGDRISLVGRAPANATAMISKHRRAWTSTSSGHDPSGQMGAVPETKHRSPTRTARL